MTETSTKILSFKDWYRTYVLPNRRILPKQESSLDALMAAYDPYDQDLEPIYAESDMFWYTSNKEGEWACVFRPSDTYRQFWASFDANNKLLDFGEEKLMPRACLRAVRLISAPYDIWQHLVWKTSDIARLVGEYDGPEDEEEDEEDLEEELSEEDVGNY